MAYRPKLIFRVIKCAGTTGKDGAMGTIEYVMLVDSEDEEIVSLARSGPFHDVLRETVTFCSVASESAT